MTQGSLDSLARIANMSEELRHLNQQLAGADTTPSPSPAVLVGGVHFATTDPAPMPPKRIACVNCRQQKSRCDAHETHPAPCSGCAKKGLHCTLKKDYKRTGRRARIAQIEREFAALKQKMLAETAAGQSGHGHAVADPSLVPTPPMHHPPDAAANLAPRTASDSNHSPEMPSIIQNPDVQPGSVFVPPTIPEAALVCEEKTLDAVLLAPGTIRSLYLEFVECYHPILPVVDVTKGPERLFRLCPALFWVVMFVALRRYEDDQKATLLALAPLIKNILAEVTISPITRYHPTEEDDPVFNACSVYSVQAFLLYTFWPPLTSSLSADSSWNTIGVALFQAIRIGLHSSTGASDGTRTPRQQEMAQEQAKTWTACNIVSQTIASSFGFPAFVQFDSATRTAPLLGPTLLHMAEIARFEDQVASTLNSNPLDAHGLLDATERVPLLKVLSRQLDSLELRDTGADGFRRFQLLTARVHLLSYYFMDTSRVALFELQRGLVRLYNAAIALVSHVNSCQARDRRFVKYLPGVYILSIWQAAFVIGKLAHSPLHKVVDVGSGRQSYQMAISLAAKASVLKHDIAYRSSGIMKSMWQLFRRLDKNDAASWSVAIRTRMAALVFFDCLYLLRERVGMIKLNSRTDSNANGAISDDDSEESSSEHETQPTEEARSAKSTPSSTGSRKKRTLSNSADAESAARKIIRTIPLDPQPMSIGGKRSSIFNVVNHSSDTSPRRSETSWPSPSRDLQPQPHPANPPKIGPSPAYEPLGPFDMDSLDISSDLLWKDVDSVMNDFGFHT